VLVSAAGISVEHDRNERALDVMYRIEGLMTLAVAGLATRADALTKRPRGRKALMYVVAAHPDRLPPALVAEQVRGAGKEGFLPALDALTDYPIRARLGEIACPTLIFWGTEDKLIPVRDAAEFERLIPDARKVVWAETGHMPMLERPAAFNALVEEFIAEQPEPAASGAPARRSGRTRRGVSAA
jgi:pimeloyl-ACP methyl ester carboxylesterase